MVRVPEDDSDCALRGRPLVCVELSLRLPTRGESACYWGGSGLGRVRAGGRVVGVPQGGTDCSLRGRPFVCVELNWRRLTRGESACYWGVGVGAG